jgi:hypothetical protein
VSLNIEVPIDGGGGTVTAAQIEATFTAANQVYKGTGSGTGALQDFGTVLNFQFAAAGQLFVGTGLGTGEKLAIGSGVLFVGGADPSGLEWATTLTGLRITKRCLELSANSATPAIDTDNYDVVHITAQTAAITSFTSGLSGTPVDGDTLRVSVTGTGAVGLTWGTSFESSTVILPTTTVLTARLDIGLLWNTETSKWRCVAVA